LSLFEWLDRILLIDLSISMFDPHRHSSFIHSLLFESWKENILCLEEAEPESVKHRGNPEQEAADDGDEYMNAALEVRMDEHGQRRQNEAENELNELLCGHAHRSLAWLVGVVGTCENKNSEGLISWCFV